ncbi:MAG: TonB-dependent receptor [Acidobacteria bacterium]|nr:TonB-dependent receptor [Acidobacteriota bacterium]
MHRLGTLTLLITMVFLGVVTTLASPTGSITGFVKDPSGAVINGVQLTLLRKDTNTRMTTATDANGAFQFLQLPPATYSLTAEASGFKKVSFASVVVQVDLVTRVDIQFELGSVSEVVEVAAATPILETDKSTLSSVVDSRVISNMPLNARQFLDLAMITPGVLPTATGTQGGGFSVAGARSQSNVFLVDGVSNQDTQINSPLNNFRITDAVQEFTVQTSVALPEFGRGTGGQVNIVTKSGTNQFHGSAFEYMRNTVFDSADFFTNKLGGKKNPLNRNQFGGTFGGPIFRDRFFFFLSYEGFRQVAPTVSSTRVPTAAERATVTDPISRQVLPFWPDPNVSIAGSTNNYIANVRAVNNDNTGMLRLDYNLSENDRLSGRWIEFRGETLTPGTTPLNGGNTNEPLSRSVVLTHTHTFSPKFINELRLGYSRNETKILVQDHGFNAASIFLGPNGQPLPGAVDATKDPENSGLPTIGVVGGFAALGSTNNLPQGRITSTYEIFDNMTYIAPFGWARHSWRWGFHIRREEARRYLNGSSRGTFNFASFADFAQGLVNTSSIRTGQTVAYFRRYPWDIYWQDQFKVKENLTLNYGFRYEYPSAIYEIRNHGTNFIPGVGPVVLGTNQILDIDPTKRGPASIFFREAPSKISSSGVNSDKNNFAPIMGFAYTPRFAEKIFGKDATVIRGGFRVGYDEVFNNIPANLSLTAPYNLITNQTANVTQPGKFSWATGFTQDVPLVSNFGRQGPGTPTSGVLSFNAVDPNIRSTYLYQYSLGIQRKFGRSFSIEVDYQGSAGHKLGMFRNINQPAVIVRDPSRRGPQAPNEQVFPHPKFGAISMGMNLGNSNYNGVVFTGKYQGRGIFFQSSYTLGKSMDYQSAFFGSLSERTGAANGLNLQLERGPSSFDIRHRLGFFYVVDVPIGPGHRLFGWDNGVARQVFGGWQISGITTIQSGAPFTVFASAVTDFSGFNLFNDRPDLARSGKLPQNHSDPDKAFDTTYFGSTPTGRVGTSGRNQYYGPGITNFDLALAKNFPFTEKFRLQLRADFFNIFNHTNFSNPQNNISNANFGKITQTVGSATATAVGTTAGPLGGPRLIQLSLRLQF